MRNRPIALMLFYAGVLLTCAILLFPVYWIAITAISEPSELHSLPPTFWPAAPNWQIFVQVMTERPLLFWMWNSTLAAFGAVTLSMAVSIFAGFSLSRFRMRGGQSLGLFILTAKMLPTTLLVIPLFAIFRTMDLIGSMWSIILAHATLIVPFSTWMLKGYFDTVPREIEQAAMVDGCSPLGALFYAVLPVATPGIAATALYGFVLSWSDYVYARTFLTNAQSNWTAVLGITTMKGEYISGWNEISAAAIIVTLPVLVVYVFLERYLVGGLTAGAEK
jgi:multiple sugar transport system permease protein